MPTTLETAFDSAKDVAYTAVGLNLLVLDRIGDRFDSEFKELDKQFGIARKHAKKAQSRWQSQYDEAAERFQDRFAPARKPAAKKTTAKKTTAKKTTARKPAAKKAPAKKATTKVTS